MQSANGNVGADLGALTVEEQFDELVASKDSVMAMAGMMNQQ